MATNENLIPIPGRLHSVATEGHVAGADEIYDDDLQKDQATLNSEAAYIDDSDPSSAVVPDFDPESQTVHIIAQTLSEQQKAQARTNLDLNDLVKYSEQTLTTTQKDQVAANLNNRPSTNGMARIELKATDNFKSVVEAQTGGNTVFVIKYDYTLTGDVTVPENCVLEFDGGSLSGAYTLTGNNTQIKAQDVAIFNNGVIIAGTWICPRIPSDWFGDATSDNRLKQLINLSSADADNHIVIKEGTYVVSNLQNAEAPIKPKRNTVIELLGSIQLTPNGFANGYIIGFEDNVTNVTLKGNGEIVGDYLLGHTGTAGEWGYNIELGDCSNITIDGLTIRNAWGDGIAVGVGYRGAPANDIVIRGCHIHTCRRQGISVIYSDGCIIENCYIHNIYGTAPECAIDVECDSETYVRNTYIRNNTLVNKKGIAVGAVVDNIESINIENNTIHFSLHYGISTSSGRNVVIQNNYIHNTSMDETNPDDSDDGVVAGDVNILNTDPQVTINGTVYYYKEIDLLGNKLTLVNTTDCVLINTNLKNIISGNTTEDYKAYIGSTTIGSYANAYTITINPVFINTVSGGSPIIKGNYCLLKVVNIGTKIYRGICSSRYSLIDGNTVNLTYYQNSPSNKPLIINNSRCVNNHIEGILECVMINSEVLNNFISSRIFTLENSDFSNNTCNVGSQSVGFAISLQGFSGRSRIFGNKIINYFDTNCTYFITIFDNAKVDIENNKIGYVPSGCFVVTQNDGYWEKEYTFKDNEVKDYSKTIDTNFLWSCKDISIPIKRETTTALNALNLNAQYAGVTAFDTDRKKEILWDGSAWVNVDGSALS